MGAGPQTGGITPGAYNSQTLPNAYPFGGGANPLQLTFNTTTMRATISSTSGAAFSLLFGTYSLGSVASVLGFQNTCRSDRVVQLHWNQCIRLFLAPFSLYLQPAAAFLHRLHESG